MRSILGVATLTRSRCSVDPTFWQVSYGDVPVGRYGPRNGVEATVHWAWAAGFYPGMDLLTLRNGAEDTEEEARAAFVAAWTEMLPTVTEAQFEEWRTYARGQGWILAMRKAGRRLPTMNSDGRAVCFCGAELTTADVGRHIGKAHRDIRP